MYTYKNDDKNQYDFKIGQVKFLEGEEKQPEVENPGKFKINSR